MVCWTFAANMTVGDTGLQLIWQQVTQAWSDMIYLTSLQASLSNSTIVSNISLTLVVVLSKVRNAFSTIG